MNRGFRLVLHKNIPDEHRKFCLEYLKSTLEYFESEQSYKVGYTNSHSFYRRGILGKTLDWAYNCPESAKGKYVFRRLVKNRRIFGVVPVDVLEGKNGTIELNGCLCAEHLGGQKVRLKDGYRDSEYEIIYEIGIIKG